MRPYNIIVGTVLVGFIGLGMGYVVLPSLGAAVLERWLAGRGYRDVAVQLGYPGLTSLAVPTLRMTHEIGNERLSLAMQDIDIQYGLSSLLSGRVTRVSLGRGTVQLVSVAASRTESQGRPDDQADDEESVNLWTIEDLTQTIPLLPFEELMLGHIEVTREQATGPLRSFTVTGVVRQGVAAPLEVDLAIQGQERASYRLTLSGPSAAALSLRLRADDLQADPIVAWQSDAMPVGPKTTLQGRLQVNVRALAPFVAWLMPVGREWDAVMGTVLASWSGTASSSVPLAALWRDAETEVQGQLQLHAQLPELKGFGKEVAVGVIANVTGNAKRMTWSFVPGTLMSAVVNVRNSLFPEALHTAVPPGRQPLRIEMARDVVGTMEWAESPTRLTVDGPVAVIYGTGAGSPRTQITLTHLVMHGRDVEAADGLLQIEGSMPTAVRDLVPARDVMGTLQGTLALDREGIRTVLLPPSRVRIRDWRQGDLAVPHAEIYVNDALPARWEFSTSRWVAGPSVLSLGFSDVRWSDHVVSARQNKLQILASEGTAMTWHARGLWQVKDVTFPKSPWPIPSSDWTMTFDANDQAIKADVHAEAHERRITVDAQVSHHLITQQGAIQGTLGPLSFDRTMFRLSQVKSPWPYPFDLTDGQVSVKVDGTWGSDQRSPSQGIQLRSGTMALSLNGLAGRYRDMLVKGVTSAVTLQVAGGTALAMPQPALVSIGSFNPGVELTNIAMTVKPEWQNDGTLSAVAIGDVRWNMFGGDVTSQGVNVVLAAPAHTIPLTLRALDLQKILSVEQQQSLQGTGVLDGTLPVTIGTKGVSVQGGTLTARPPGGVIRYGASDHTAKAITQSNVGMAFVLQALNNFHYNVLQVGVDYTEDGTLHLRTRLEGRNPDAKKSPPVHFNLTVQESVPALLKSLQLVQNIEESVQKKFVKP